MPDALLAAAAYTAAALLAVLAIWMALLAIITGRDPPVTKLSSRLPDGNTNGLPALAPRLVSDPHMVHVAVVLLDCQKTTLDYDTGETIPTARVRAIEPITGIDRDLAAQMMRRAVESRTGQTVLPIELEDELSAVFENLGPASEAGDDAPDGVDPETGEIDQADDVDDEDAD